MDLRNSCRATRGTSAGPTRRLAGSCLVHFFAVAAEQSRSGNVAFNVTTVAPVSPIPGAPGCPNPNWTQTIDDLLFKTGTITVEQPPGTLVLTISCTFSQPTTNGAVPRADVVCTSN